MGGVPHGYWGGPRWMLGVELYGGFPGAMAGSLMGAGGYVLGRLWKGSHLGAGGYVESHTGTREWGLWGGPSGYWGGGVSGGCCGCMGRPWELKGAVRQGLEVPGAPVDARALDAESDAQVDAGPLGCRLTAVTALCIALQPLHQVQHSLVGGLPWEACPAPRLQCGGRKRGWALHWLQGTWGGGRGGEGVTVRVSPVWGDYGGDLCTCLWGHGGCLCTC